MYFAHVNDQGKRQTVEEHLAGTAAFAEPFAAQFGAGEFGKCCAMLHDAGKYSAGFQKHILGDPRTVDHSTAGAKAVWEATRSGPGLMAAYCIAGHHAGLPDGGSRADTPDEPTLFARLKRTVPDFNAYFENFTLGSLLPKTIPPIQPIGRMGFSAAFFIRMLFSCLVDADFLDTERFMSGGGVRRDGGDSIPALNRLLKRHLARYASPGSRLNEIRNEILKDCIQKADGPKGLYTLTVPTGGGKTLSSLAFALQHAETHQMGRIVYAIPYTSIIEQNAAVFRKILGDQNVLEHHCNFEYDDRGEEPDPHRLAAENWDLPVVVTTNVQLFESLFANKPSRCRKLHNLANSVIIFDEAQMIPRNYLQPCIRAISELTLNYGCTAVLCSATQPALQGLFPPEVKSAEICESVPRLYGLLRRTTFRHAGVLDDQTLADRLNARKQVLCIVNTRAHAQALYSMLQGDGCFHLSTLMYPEHRKSVLDEIRKRLKQGETCRVVSTSLIEAGVDVDFPAVYREAAGLDSKIQAAGRCNREGKRPADESCVILFESEEKYRGHLPASMQRPMDVAKIVEGKFDDIASPQAIQCYFETLYRVSGQELDQKGIVEKFEDGAANQFSFPFAEVAEEFQLIENAARPVLIPREAEAAELAERLRRGERGRELLRRAGMYCVNIYKPQFQALYDAGKIQPLDSQIAVLEDPDSYSEQIGLAGSAPGGSAWFV